MKVCPKCREQVDARATICPHCRSKFGFQFSCGAVGCILIIVIISIYSIGSFIAGMSRPSSSPATPIAEKQMGIGDEGYVRLPGNNDETQLIMLGPTTESAGEIGHALMANDMQGLIEIPGVFAVENGTRAKLIDISFPYRRVRIMEGSQSGKSGWLPLEWVVSK